MKHTLFFLFRFSFLIALLGVLIYLGSVNRVSEVYIDLVATKISCDVSEEAEDLVYGIQVDSLQLRNCNLKLKLSKIVGAGSRPVTTESGILEVTKRDSDLDSEVNLSKQGQMLLKQLSIPAFTHVDVVKDSNTIRLELTTDPNATEAYRGKIDAGGGFLFTGRNVELSALDRYLDYDTLSISTHRIVRNLTFEANAAKMTLVLYLSPVKVDIYEIIDNQFISNISFVETDRSRRQHRETSTIKGGNVQIAGVDMFNKRFLLKEETLEENDFLDIDDSDEYFLSSMSVTDEGFRIAISSEAATELEKGKRIRLLRSLLPSMLDFIVAEPSKKTFWGILVFVLAQFTVFRRTLTAYFTKDKTTP